MPRDGAIIFRDLIGKLGVLRVERGTSAIRLTADIGAIIVDVAEVPNVWSGRALQDGVPRPTNVRAASMY
jgi:hypothetical protein